MTIQCRPASSSDIPAVCLLLAQLGYSFDESALVPMIAEIRSREGEVFVAVTHGTVVGCINVIVDVRLAEGKCGEVASLVVSADHRGQGVGHQLLAHAQEWLSERVNTMRIRANVTRHEAHGFYLSANFTVAKEQKVFTKALGCQDKEG
ncbi:GNAT family N-acetyltransferase [Vreelandella sp. GE22]